VNPVATICNARFSDRGIGDPGIGDLRIAKDAGKL
jgi:hypothetical protein